MSTNATKKVSTIDYSEQQTLILQERQRRRLLRIEEAKKQANLLSRSGALKVYNHSQKVAGKANKETTKEEDSCCPRLLRYQKVMETKFNGKK